MDVLTTIYSWLSAWPEGKVISASRYLLVSGAGEIRVWKSRSPSMECYNGVRDVDRSVSNGDLLNVLNDTITNSQQQLVLVATS